MKKSLKVEIEEYVAEWHYDEKSLKYAFELGIFLFAFIDYINDLNLAEKTKSRHRDNVYFIGDFEMRYNFEEVFAPENLEDALDNSYNFEIKVSNSKSAVQSYESTCRKLEKFIKSKAYEPYLKNIEDKITKK